jgi:hypothetical protein
MNEKAVTSSGSERWFLDRIRQLAVGDSRNDVPRLQRMLHLLARHRAQVLHRHLFGLLGPAVQGGPFAGMKWPGRVTEGCQIPKLLGCYESELHPHVVRLGERNYEHIVNVGCAEGYYAVGLARLLPGVVIHAHDTDEKAQAMCRDLVALNDVGERILVGGLFQPTDFERFADRRTLVICDIEGAEEDLLDPVAAPTLLRCDMIVELHPFAGKTDLPRRVLQRFADSHEIVEIQRTRIVADIPQPLWHLSHLDQFLAAWEMRSIATPWAVLRARSFGD